MTRPYIKKPTFPPKFKWVIKKFSVSAYTGDIHLYDNTDNHHVNVDGYVQLSVKQIKALMKVIDDNHLLDASINFKQAEIYASELYSETEFQSLVEAYNEEYALWLAHQNEDTEFVKERQRIKRDQIIADLEHKLAQVKAWKID